MNTPISLRAFIGAKDFALSRQFYLDLGCQEVIIDYKMSYFSFRENLGFYLQRYYAKEWVDNSMLFLEVENITHWHKEIQALELPNKYERVKLSGIVHNDWGSEFFLHDPSGVLWHVGTFTPSSKSEPHNV